MPIVTILDLLGRPRIAGQAPNPIAMALAVRRGLPWRTFEALVSALAITQAELAAKLHIHSRTLARRKAAGRLEAMESDRAFRLARILAHAVEVFESIERARDWLKSENRALDGQPPFELLDTDAGAQEVDDVLGRIEHGIFS
ncbi:MAG TPA: antitoxin Xre/MbcA/ParS toxin-binding domain-containing protein [Thermoanaerobaculia bacterium]|jgi:putative toxin-antitoxin system antitoxin component (TIGR02293 family)